MQDPVPTVDLSADLGEDEAAWVDVDAALLQVVTTAHVACGFHAGGPRLMRRTVAAAAAAGVVVGAHPSYPDATGFGRRAMDVPPSRVADDVLYQVGALEALARAEGTRVCSVKPHGALYHRMAVDGDCIAAVATALAAVDPGIRLVLPAGSTVAGVATDAGVATVAEGFCDRGYLPDGSLAERGHDGALVTDPEEAARRARRLVTAQHMVATDGSELPMRVDTLCVHGDTPGAVAIARRVRLELEAAGVAVVPAGRR